jgi:hypothetical protein
MGFGVSNLWVQIIPKHGNLHNLLLQKGFGKTHSLSLQLTQKIVHSLSQDNDKHYVLICVYAY